MSNLQIMKIYNSKIHRLILSGTFGFAINHNFAISQQNPFKQFYVLPATYNSAFAGIGSMDNTQTARFGIQYQNSFTESPNGQKSLGVNYDQKFKQLHGGLGLSVVDNSVATQYKLAYSYHLKISEKLQLNLGANYAVMQNTLITQKNSIGGGFALLSKNFYLGLAANNLNKASNDFFAPPQLIVTGGYQFKIKTNKYVYQIIPQFNYYNQHNFSEYTVGCNVKQANVNVGAWYLNSSGQYRNTDAFAFNLGYQLKNFKFMYSYAFNLSNGRSAMPSTHELSLVYSFKTKKPVIHAFEALN